MVCVVVGIALDDFGLDFEHKNCVAYRFVVTAAILLLASQQSTLILIFNANHRVYCDDFVFFVYCRVGFQDFMSETQLHVRVVMIWCPLSAYFLLSQTVV